MFTFANLYFSTRDTEYCPTAYSINLNYYLYVLPKKMHPFYVNQVFLTFQPVLHIALDQMLLRKR